MTMMLFNDQITNEFIPFIDKSLRYLLPNQKINSSNLTITFFFVFTVEFCLKFNNFMKNLTQWEVAIC